MKKYITLCLALLTLTMSLTAQDQDKSRAERDKKRSEMKSEKAAYVTQYAGLSADEATAYWALRNDVDKSKKALKKDARDKDFDIETATDAEIEENMRNKMQAHAKADALELENLSKFINIVGARKLAMIKQGERKFKRTVLRDLRHDDVEEREIRKTPADKNRKTQSVQPARKG